MADICVDEGFWPWISMYLGMSLAHWLAENSESLNLVANFSARVSIVALFCFISAFASLVIVEEGVNPLGFKTRRIKSLESQTPLFGLKIHPALN